MSTAVGNRRTRVQPPAAEATVVLGRGDVDVATWPLETGGRCDLEVVDELARMALGARRLGCSLRLRNAGAQLSGLLDLVGLGELITPVARHPTL